MRDAKNSSSKLVKRAAAGEGILIAKNGTPIAMLTRLPPKHRKMPWGNFEGKIHMTDDFEILSCEWGAPVDKEQRSGDQSPGRSTPTKLVQTALQPAVQRERGTSVQLAR